jgi:tRNA G10  N-methylase Trm11
MGDTHNTYSTLFAIAARRLKPGGRLVFWLPTDAFITEEDMQAQLREMVAQAGTMAEKSLVLQRTTKEELHDALWRWMCVYQKA